MKNLNALIRLSTLVAIGLFSSFAYSVETVDYVDLQKYVGRWYEVASIPAKFQKKCIKNVTAEYNLLENGKIEVINSCLKQDGHYETARGIAQVKNTKTQAELGVSFVPFFNRFGWFEGQYKVLSLGRDYDYALIGEDKLKYGWILSRSPQLSLATLMELEKVIRAKGYDSCRFLTTLQDGGLFQERTPLCQLNFK